MQRRPPEGGVGNAPGHPTRIATRRLGHPVALSGGLQRQGLLRWGVRGVGGGRRQRATVLHMVVTLGQSRTQGPGQAEVDGAVEGRGSTSVTLTLALTLHAVDADEFFVVVFVVQF